MVYKDESWVNNWGFRSHGGSPIAGWFVREHANLKWIITRGSPVSGNLHMGITMFYDILKYSECAEWCFYTKLELGGPTLWGNNPKTLDGCKSESPVDSTLVNIPF